MLGATDTTAHGVKVSHSDLPVQEDSDILLIVSCSYGSLYSAFLATDATARKLTWTFSYYWSLDWWCSKYLICIFSVPAVHYGEALPSNTSHEKDHFHVIIPIWSSKLFSMAYNCVINQKFKMFAIKQVLKTYCHSFNNSHPHIFSISCFGP